MLLVSDTVAFKFWMPSRSIKTTLIEGSVFFWREAIQPGSNFPFHSGIWDGRSVKMKRFIISVFHFSGSKVGEIRFVLFSSLKKRLDSVHLELFISAHRKRSVNSFNGKVNILSRTILHLLIIVTTPSYIFILTPTTLKSVAKKLLNYHWENHHQSDKSTSHQPQWTTYRNSR